MDSTLEPQISLLPDNKNHRPPLKWAGGKRWLVPHLRPLWSNHSQRRLVEPLCGGLAVTLGLQPRMALLNDVNEHLINFYAWLKRGLVIEFNMLNDEGKYYTNRERFNHLIRTGQAKSKESAGLFYYLNRTGYNGLCRFNQSGEFNVPFGKYKQINYEGDFLAYKKTFAKWKFTNTSFDKVPLQDGDFVYADPPYDVEFRQYSKDGFEWDDQVRLAEWLAAHSGPVVLSNQATERIVTLYEKLGFQLQFLQAPRMISCTGDRTPAREVLAFRGV
ncbi:MAG: Dam family site-specific DNA-(adenine-N6)-methyltransferase [Chloroflexota bacterium]